VVLVFLVNVLLLMGIGVPLFLKIIVYAVCLQ
jgi:hypothetical protein